MPGVYDVIPKDWLDNDQINTVVVGCYSSALSGSSSLTASAIRAIEESAKFVPGKWSVTFGVLDEQNVDQAKAQWVYVDGQPSLIGGRNRIHIHRGGYLLLFTPLFLNAEQRDEGEVVRRAEWVRGVLTATFGHTAMQDHIFNQRYSTEDPNIVEFVSPRLQTNLLPKEWNVFSDDAFAALGVALDTNIDPDVRQRVETALKFIGRAASDIDPVTRFSHVWIALEIVAGGHAYAKNFLNSLKDFRVEAKRLVDMRNALFHHGIWSHQIQSEERLLTNCVLAMVFRCFGINDSRFDEFVRHYIAERAVFQKFPAS